MSSDRGQTPDTPDPRDVDAEFARMLEGEGLVLRPGEAPREPAAPAPRGPGDRQEDGGTGEPADDDSLWSFSADSPPEPPSPESIARSRAAHPAAGAPDPTAGLRGAVGPRELDDDEALYGDFEPPDPDLPAPSEGALWSWTALLLGFVLMLVVTVTPSLPAVLGWMGGVAALGGIVSLLLRAPREPRDDGDDGAEV
ncbi:hypothetical protein ACT3SP_16930 [Brachybacterium sp. AOP43-C2-M15]|uniref:hypothetical protein n=1 Tax=Brachybacterium sp. AOP43-C2-M15 TaxID=3457661 RepID=UPI004034C10D